MEVFRAILQIYLALIGINIVLVLALWRATRLHVFLIYMFHWCFLLLAFFVQRAAAQEEAYLRLLASTIPNFLTHSTLTWVYANIAGISAPLRKMATASLLSMPCTFALHLLGAPSEVLAIPLVLTHASFYFYIVYKAVRHRSKQLSFSLKIISPVLVLYGLHLLDYAYFYTRLELLIYGFTLAFIFYLSFSILIPAAIIETISKENVRLATEMEYKARLIHSAKMAALGEMAGGVAHEINNPLAILSIISDQIQQRLGPAGQNPEIHPLLEKLDSTVQRMANIVRGLLTFSKEDRTGNFTDTSVSKIIETTLPLCTEKFKSYGVDFQVLLPPEALEVRAHPVQISQVLLNLLNNAFDAVQNKSQKRITLKVKGHKDFVEFSVSDNGDGVPAELQEKIFQPFFTTKAIGSGTGLGLSISKGIIESHGGRIFLDTDSKETRFVVQIPRVPSSSQES